MSKCDFIIVGAMKAGTTSLAAYLSHHPDLYMPDEELHFFDDFGEFEKGMESYTANFAAATPGQLKGEKTPTYSYDPAVPERMYKHLPHVKLIWIFREPVARAYSNYLHAVRLGTEKLGFEKACKLEKERIESDFTKGYLTRSVYIEQVNRYLKYFPREQMLFLFQEDLKNDTRNILEKTCHFLGVRYHDGLENLRIEANPTYIPKSKLLQYYGRKLFNNTPVFSFIWRINMSKKKGYQKPVPELVEALKAKFSDSNKKLEELTGRDLSAWNS